MKTIKVLQGLPASGKTTWAREWVNEDPKNRIRVNRDDIRKMLGPYWIPQREDLVTKIENGIILKAIDMGFAVVVDATNFRGTQRFYDLLCGPWDKDVVDIEVIDHFLEVPLRTCIQRDQQRSGS